MITGRLQRLREWSPLLPLLLLFGATYWLNQQVQPMPLASNNNKRHDPDFIASNFSATTLDEQGIPHFILDAPRMLHYPDDDVTHLDEPRLRSLYPDHPPVYTSAQRGEISGNGSDIYLYDNVKIIRAASTEQSEMTLSSSYLHVAPDLDLMETDRPVTMSDAYNVIHSTGMKFDNKTRILKLLAKVHAQHEIIQH